MMGLVFVISKDTLLAKQRRRFVLGVENMYVYPSLTDIYNWMSMAEGPDFTNSRYVAQHTLFWQLCRCLQL